MRQTDPLVREPLEAVYTLSQIRDLEQAICASRGIGMPALMQQAGEAVYAFFAERQPEAMATKVFCGAGHNGGDAWVFAYHAHQQGKQVTVVSMIALAALSGDVAEVAKAYVNAGGVYAVWPEVGDTACDWVVDGLLGIGASGAVRAPYDAAVVFMQSLKAPVLAIDVPTGLDAETGAVHEPCVKADITATLLGLKWGLVTGEALNYVGDLQLLPLHDAKALSFSKHALAYRLRHGRMVLPKRQNNSHKGDYGRVLLIGGMNGMTGAICLAAEAAARVGAGYVQVSSQSCYLSEVLASKWDFLLLPLEDDAALAHALDQTAAVLIGPGLGQGDLAKQVLARVLGCKKPLVVDADALSLLAQSPCKLDNGIITPHPGEAGRLLGQSTEWVQSHRKLAIEMLTERYGAHVVLKGAGTLMLGPESDLRVSGCGNPGMAVAGMGDVLGGMIAGFLAQGLTLGQAKVMGVMNHAGLSDSLVGQLGESGLMASDLLPHLGRWVDP